MRGYLDGGRKARVATLSALAALSLALSACSMFGGDDKPTLANMPADLAVDPYLWEGTLETINFLPITTQSPSTGRIETGWGDASGNPGEQERIIVQIQPGIVTHDSVAVQVLRRVNGQPASVNASAAPTVQEAILLRARQIKTAVAVE